MVHLSITCFPMVFLNLFAFLIQIGFIWSEKNLIPLFKQILNGLNFLHSHGISMYNLTPDNIHVTFLNNQVFFILHFVIHKFRLIFN